MAKIKGPKRKKYNVWEILKIKIEKVLHNKIACNGPADDNFDDVDDRQPTDQTADPVQQLAVHHVRLLPGVGEHSLEINLLVTVGTGLLLAHNAPTSDAELMELVSTGKSECVLNHTFLLCSHQQFVGTNWNIVNIMFTKWRLHFTCANVCL